MYLNELLPDCIAAGMSANEFWHSYPKEITPYFKALERKRRFTDEEQYMQYMYFSNAIETALHNAFKKKGQKAREHLNKPLLKQYEDEHRELTEDEKSAQVALLFDNLAAMQRCFEQSKDGGQ